MKDDKADSGEAADEQPQPQPKAVVMPDGQVVLLSPANPLREAAESATGQAQPEDGPQPADSDNTHIYFTADLPSREHEIVMRALYLERMARVVRLLALIDMVFSAMQVITSWPAAIAAAISYCGYLGAKTFRRDLNRIFLIFLILCAVGRAFAALHFIFSPPLPHLPPSLPFYLSLSALLQLIIARFVYRFHCMRPTTEEGARLMQDTAERATAMLVV